MEPAPALGDVVERGHGHGLADVLADPLDGGGHRVVGDDDPAVAAVGGPDPVGLLGVVRLQQGGEFGGRALGAAGALGARSPQLSGWASAV